MNCRHAAESICQSLDNEATLSWSLRLHLWTCSHCRRFRRQIIAIHQALPQVDHDDGIKLSEQARQRIRQKIESQ